MLRLTDHLELQRFLQSCHEVWNLGTPGGALYVPQRPEQTRGLKVADVGNPCPSYTPPQNTASPLEGFRKDAGEAVLLCPEQSGSEGPPPFAKG